MWQRWSLLMVVALASAGRAHAADTTPTPKEFADIVRGMLLNNLPSPLVESSPGWGRQVGSVVGHKMRNQGAWRKLHVSAMNPTQTLHVEARKLERGADGHTSFNLLVDFDAQVDFEQQIWERGLRLYSGKSQARAKVAVDLQCEVTTRAEVGHGAIPDLVFQLKVVKANLSYSGLDFVHIGAIGGDGADIIGHALVDTIKAVKPSLERDLLAKADAALVKAGNNKEFRISLGKLLKSK
jgi:hypothetical protein